MEKINYSEDLTSLLKRINIVKYIVSIALLFVLIFYWKIQIVDHKNYLKLAEINRIRRVDILASRGFIYDRNGRVIVDNRPSFNLTIDRDRMSELFNYIDNLSNILEVRKKSFIDRILNSRKTPYYLPLVLKKDIPIEKVSFLEARKDEFFPLEFQIEPVRNYPFNSLAFHIFGYIGEAFPEEISKTKDIKAGSFTGKMGLEKQYDKILRGKDGWVDYAVDIKGKIIEELERKEPEKGNDLVLTIDIDLQNEVEKYLENRKGGIVLINPKNGEILAMASSPGFNPNLFVSEFSEADWRNFISDENYPFYNRVIQGQYSPGSIFKLLIALAGLQEKVINPDERISCSGSYQSGNKVFRCWKELGHGSLNLYEAIKHSCNVYFYKTGKRLGIEKIKKYAKKFGLGEYTGIDISGERAGLVPDPSWKMKYLEEPWYSGETISISIGQGYILTTPIQIVNFVSAIANRGKKIVPHVARGYYENNKFQKFYFEQNPKEIDIDKEYFEYIIDGMWGSVNDSGTGARARLSGFDVCGKTGTTQVVSKIIKDKNEFTTGITPHSWFTGFASKDNPEVAIAIIIEHAGKGGENAAPIAGKILNFYFNGAKRNAH
ncbi:MAG: penicillin-binding protein 2 [Acidobacteriota bacterium]